MNTYTLVSNKAIEAEIEAIELSHYEGAGND